MTKQRSLTEINKEYKQALRWENRHKELEPLLNDFECSLSGDFENYTLEELNEALRWFNNLAGMKDDRETISPSKSQQDSRDYLWFRIEQEKHKDCPLCELSENLCEFCETYTKEAVQE